MKLLKLNWKRPKYLLKKTTSYIAFISLVSSTLALLIFYVLKYSPFMFYSLDYSMPNYYSNKIVKLHEKAISSNDDRQKLKYYNILLKELDGVTNLHKFYPLVKESISFIVNKLIENKKFNLAEKTAFKWQERFPYDFNAKFLYIKTLKLNYPDKAILYYQNLYKNHHDIYEVNSHYVNFLLELGQYDKAYNIAYNAQFNLINNKDPSFKIYTEDKNNNKFSILGSYNIAQENIHKSGKIYHIKSTINVNQYKKIAINIFNVPTESLINIKSFQLTTDTKTYEFITVVPSHESLKYSNGFIVNQDNTRFTMMMPEEIIGYSGAIKINAIVEISNNNHPILNKILLHPKWRIGCSNEKTMIKSQFSSINFQAEKKQFTAQINMNEIKENKDDYCKLYLPPFINMPITLEFYSKNKILPKSSITQLHNIQILGKNKLIVTGIDTYIDFDLTSMDSFDEIKLTLENPNNEK